MLVSPRILPPIAISDREINTSMPGMTRLYAIVPKVGAAILVTVISGLLFPVQS